MGNFIFSTENVTIILAVVILAFILVNKPNPTFLLRTVLLGVIGLLSEMILEVSLYLYMQKASHPTEMVVTVFVLLILTANILVISSLVGYVNRIALRKVMDNTLHHDAYLIFFLVYLFVAYTLCQRGKMFQIDGNILTINTFVRYFNTLNIIATTGCFINVLTHKMLYPKGLYRMITRCAPILILLQIGQQVHPQHIVHGIFYVIPLMVFYFFYHSNPHDQITGYQDAGSLHAMLSHCIRSGKKYHMIYIHLPRLQSSEFIRKINLESESYVAVIQACRSIEYAYKNVKIYRYDQASFVILYSAEDNVKVSGVKEKIKEAIEFASREVGERLNYNAYYISSDDRITDTSKGTALISYFARKFYSVDENVWIECTPKMIDEYFVYQQIEDTLKTIARKNYHRDSAVICFAQPIYDVKAKQFRTAESLMRMRINGQTIYPDVFIPIAEANGTLHALTKIMLNYVCASIKKWKDKYDFDAITVNFSAMELADDSIFDEIVRILYQHEVDPSYLRIEITESAMIEDSSRILENIMRLHNFGIQFYLDDFGTGYSNFERIVNLPFDIIKFDKSILYKAMDDERMDDMLSSMVSLFKKNGFRTLVEGVETEEHARYSVDHGLEYLQGYHYSRPIPIEELTQFFTLR